MKIQIFLKVICLILACFALGGGIYLLSFNSSDSIQEITEAGTPYGYAAYMKGAGRDRVYALGGGQVAITHPGWNMNWNTVWQEEVQTERTWKTSSIQ